jgi:hypothetical protein
MWKWRKALAVTAPTVLLAAWMVPPTAEGLLVDLPAAPEPAVMLLAGIFLIGTAAAIRRTHPASPLKS